MYGVVSFRYTYGEGVVGELRLTLGVLTKSNNTVAVFKELTFALNSRVRQYDHNKKLLVINYRNFNIFVNIIL